ncbi:MAG: DNA-formamidopyrimidine glycosylase family protein, partial [Pseudomonadota bacterium]|nr:DNA-formamidopyrimidine glycosylase family protein [Pseudomonadota bacterium]
MPELPEVETVRRGLAPVLENTILTGVEVRAPKLRWPVPSDLAGRLTGNRVLRLARCAKYLLIWMEDSQVVLIHLGMSGHMTVWKEPPPVPGRHDHLDFVTE